MTHAKYASRMALAALVCSGGTFAGGIGVTTQQVAADPAKAWERFLVEARVKPVHEAYAVLDQVGYDLKTVKADECKAQSKALADAVEAAPVSIAVRHAAMLCSEAVSDEAGAEAQFSAIAALAKLALAQASEVEGAEPIRVPRFEDALALIEVSGLRQRYMYYEDVRPERYFPLAIAVWDDEAKVEKRFRFDFVDATFAINREDPASGFPMQRHIIAEAFLEGQTRINLQAAWDIRAFQQASQVADAKAKIEKLRPATEAGGLRSGLLWALICARRPYPGCGAGLADALLPLAEEEYASPMTLLAFVYAEGIGVPADAATASKLLDAADARSSHAQAGVDYASLWRFAHDEPLPADLVARLSRAEAKGNRNARTFLITQKIYGEDKTALTAEEISHLSQPDQNGAGQGFALLSKYYGDREQPQQRLHWLAKAAEAGHAGSQSDYGWLLWQGKEVPQDREAGLRWHERAAQGGDVWAARFMAMQSAKSNDGKAAEQWLSPAVWSGSDQAALDMAELFERRMPGVSGDPAQAVKIYRALADGGDADGRLHLARAALNGSGMAKDPQEAKKLLLLNAKENHAESQGLLGVTLMNGSFGAADEKEGLRWVELAMKAKDANTFASYGAWLYYTKNTLLSRQQGLQVWERGMEAGSSLSANNAAWARCTSPDANIADPAKGMNAVAKMGKAEDMDASLLDTVAACRAASGDFKGAVQIQSQAIAQVVKQVEGRDPALPVEPADNADGYRRRLALYEAGKPYVETTRD